MASFSSQDWQASERGDYVLLGTAKTIKTHKLVEAQAQAIIRELTLTWEETLALACCMNKDLLAGPFSITILESPPSDAVTNIETKYPNLAVTVDDHKLIIL